MAQSSPSMTPQLPRVDSSPLYDHAVSPAPGSETELVAAAIFEFKMHRRQDELDHERWMRYYQRDRERHERWMRDHERDRERHRLRIETHRENSAGLQQLRRDMANSNSPRFSRRGTPTGTPQYRRSTTAPNLPPVKHPLRRHTAPYQAADRHPGPPDRVHDGRYTPYQQPPPQPMQPTVSDPPPESAHHCHLSTPQTSADSRHSLEDGPSRVTPSVVGVSHRLDHEFTVRGDSAVLPPGSLTNITLMQETEPPTTSNLAVVKADGSMTLPRPLVDVQGNTPMPCSLVADLSVPAPCQAWQPDDPTDPTPDLVGDQLTLEVESGLASLV